MIADVVQILYDATDITNSVLYEKARFESLMAAVPGSFEITVRDPDRTLSFTTGHEITLKLNGEVVFGGIIWEITKTNMFPAVETSGDVITRLWVLKGTDFNIILDKRVLHNISHYTKAIFSPGKSSYSVAVITPITDGEVIRGGPARGGLNLGGLQRFFDLVGYDTTDETNIIDNYTWQKGFTWPTQGTRLRETMVAIATPDKVSETTAISTFYVDGAKKFHFIPEHELAVSWGFSDRPDNATTFPFREASGTESAMSVVNDALVWGGTNWTTGTDNDIVFARVQDATSIADHSRWQASDVAVGSQEATQQAQVDLRADTMVNGPPGTLLGKNMGLGLPERTFSATWLNARVPEVLIPGHVVPITLEVFGDAPIELPLRSLSITWPGLNEDGSRAWTQFEGKFGLLQSDPSWLWRYLQKLRPGKIIKQVTATAKNDTSKPPYGAIYQDQPATQTIVGEAIQVNLDLPNGSKTLFHIPFMYVGNTMHVFVSGFLQYREIQFSETSPALGTFTLFDAPSSLDQLWVTCVVAGTLV